MIDNTVLFKDLKTNNIIQDKIITINDREVHIKQYLTINEKLELITRVLNLAINANKYNFINPVQLEVFTIVEIIKAYAGIVFNDLESDDGDEDNLDYGKIYDELKKERIITKIICSIPSEEYNYVRKGISDTIESYYKYQTSVLGMMETISKDYSNLNFEATEIENKLKNPENLALLRKITEKLG